MRPCLSCLRDKCLRDKNLALFKQRNCDLLLERQVPGPLQTALVREASHGYVPVVGWQMGDILVLVEGVE